MRPVRGVVFDLDDTLYLERDYVRSGFRAVADRVAGRVLDADAAFDLLWSGFLRGERGRAFHALVDRFPGLGGHELVPELVETYRTHRPEIDYLPGMPALLDELADHGVGLAVVSDGPLASQAAKAEALDVHRWARPVVLTDAWGREFWKPHTRAFTTVAGALDLDPSRLVYVGDNPEKDFHVSHTLGWTTVRLRIPDQVRFDLPHDRAVPTAVVSSVGELRRYLLDTTDGTALDRGPG